MQYYEEIKRILQDTYEVNSPTLDFRTPHKRGAGREDIMYFYTLGREYEDEIASVRDALSRHLSGSAPGKRSGLIQRFKKDKRALPQCAVLMKHQDGNWELSFHFVREVRYHMTYGRHAAATLMILPVPEVFLCSKYQDTFYGYWEETRTYSSRPGDGDGDATEGLNYRVNRNLICKEQFRNFTAEFFSTVADAEKLYILKDISRTIRKYGFFLPSVPFPDVMLSRTPEEIIRSAVPGSAAMNINFNRTDLNKGCVIASLAPAVCERDMQVLKGMTPEIIKKCFSLKNAFDGFKSKESVGEFIENYYRYVRGFTKSEERIAGDYVKMCLDTGTPVRLSASVKKLTDEHDGLARLIRKKKYLEDDENEVLVPAPSRFDRLERSLDFLCPNAFRRIRTSGQLLDEGEFQHNCVCSRKGLIENDRAAVFHWDYDNSSHTVQFACIRGKYYLDEIKARFNEECSPSAMNRLHELLDAANYCELITDSERVQKWMEKDIV